MLDRPSVVSEAGTGEREYVCKDNNPPEGASTSEISIRIALVAAAPRGSRQGGRKVALGNLNSFLWCEFFWGRGVCVRAVAEVVS